MTNPELLPCPFCGSEPATEYFEMQLKHSAYCGRCFETNHVVSRADTESELIAAWNRRHYPAAIVDALRSARSLVLSDYEGTDGMIEPGALVLKQLDAALALVGAIS